MLGCSALLFIIIYTIQHTFGHHLHGACCLRFPAEKATKADREFMAISIHYIFCNHTCTQSLFCSCNPTLRRPAFKPRLPALFSGNRPITVMLWHHHHTTTSSSSSTACSSRNGFWRCCHSCVRSLIEQVDHAQVPIRLLRSLRRNELPKRTRLMKRSEDRIYRCVYAHNDTATGNSLNNITLQVE